MYEYEVIKQQTRFFLDDEPIKDGVFIVSDVWDGKFVSRIVLLNGHPVEGFSIKWRWQAEDECDVFMYSKP